jgi:hypothetical protein
VVTFNNTTASTSVNNASVLLMGGLSVSCVYNATNISNGGALTVGGGASVSKDLFVGGDVSILSTTPSNDASSGALVINGGVGVSGNLNVLGNTIITGNLTVNGQTTSIDTTNMVVKDNILVLNSGPSGTTNSGFIIQRYQSDNNSAQGDVVSDNPKYSFVLPDQSGMTSIQLKLGITASDVNDFYTGCWVDVLSGFSSNQVRSIISYNGTTKIAVLSTPFFNQNPSIGDTVYLYNKPYVGLIFDELNNRFIFGSTTQQNNINFSDYINLASSSISSYSTQDSVSPTVGAIVTNGGIGISCTSDAVSLTNGGSITSLGGASISKTLIVGESLYVNGANMTPNKFDMYSSQTGTFGNNVMSFTNINGVIFDKTLWGFDLYLVAYIDASTNLYTNFHIRGINKNTEWEIVKTYVGDDTGIEFNINNDGQLTYTSSNYTDFNSGVFKWRAFVN